MESQPQTVSESLVVNTPSSARKFMSIVTVILALFNLGIEAIIDAGEWLDVGGLSNIIPYRGLGISLLRGIIFFAMIFVLVYRGKGAALVIAMMGAAFYVLLYLI